MKMVANKMALPLPEKCSMDGKMSDKYFFLVATIENWKNYFFRAQ